VHSVEMWKTGARPNLAHRRWIQSLSRLGRTQSTIGFMKLTTLVFFCANVLAAAANNNASDALWKADHYADLYNWASARPLFLAADRELPHGSPEQVHAHLGYLRATMETRSLPELSNYLGALLNSPEMTSNPRLRLWCLGIKGDVDGEMDSASARADWEEAHRVATKLNDKKWESRSLAEAGFNAYIEGDIAAGRRNVAAGLGMAHRTGDIGAEIRYLSAIGTGIEWNGAYQEALGYFQKAQLLAKQNPDAGYQFLTVAGEVETLIKQAHFQEAEDLVKNASAQATQSGKLIKLTQLMLFDADIALGEKQPQRAIEILQKTIPLARRNQTRMLADAEMKLAEIYREQHKLALAERYASAAFAHTHLTNDLFTAPARLEFTAQLQWDLGRRVQARRSIMRALEISEGLLSQTSSGAVREGLLTAMSSAYETAFTFAAQSGDLQGAFAIVERVRGRITTETLLQPTRAIQQRMDMALEDKIRNLKIQLLKASAPVDRDRLIDQLFYTEQQRFVEDKPAPFTVQKIEAIPVRRLTAKLGGDEAILEYVLPDKGDAYCLFLSQKSARIVPLGPAQQISVLARNFIADVKDKKPWKENAQALYGAVLAPIRDISQFKRLTIVPDGALHLVPFDALRSPTGKLLGESAVTSYAPSVMSDVLLKTRSEPQMQRAFLGVGGAIYNEAGTQPFTLAKSNARGGYFGVDPAKLPNLPGSGEEVQSAADILRSIAGVETLQTGKAATEFAFTHAPLANFEVIHLAIHAVANQDDPSRAALIFPPDTEHREDGFLEPREIARLHFGARVIVLSACDTAVGRLQGQVGVANLARAFLQAGADSVISTLWPVDDMDSLLLMQAFYRHLVRGDDVASALALAKRDMLDKLGGGDASPSSWAGFVLLGNGGSSLRSSQTAEVRGLRIQ
jgi:CHAT domain-containing protein